MSKVSDSIISHEPVIRMALLTSESEFGGNLAQQLSERDTKDENADRMVPCSRPRPDGDTSIYHEQTRPAQAVPAVTVQEQVKPGIELRRHHRLKASLVSNETLVYVRSGILSLEVVPASGRRQILDFLMPGDTIPASVGVTSPGFFLRALTDASLEKQCSGADDEASQERLEQSTMLHTLRAHLMRRNLHQIMIGQLTSELRVSSFLLMLALRCCHSLKCNLFLSMPMSRDDIADYLAMNCDTLSRVMMRLETLRIIRRFNRHSLHLIDHHKLAQLSSIGTLLITALGSVGLRPN